MDTLMQIIGSDIKRELIALQDWRETNGVWREERTAVEGWLDDITIIWAKSLNIALSMSLIELMDVLNMQVGHFSNISSDISGSFKSKFQHANKYTVLRGIFALRLMELLCIT